MISAFLEHLQLEDTSAAELELKLMPNYCDELPSML